MEAKARFAGLAALIAFVAAPVAAQQPPGIQIRSIAHGSTAALRSYPPTPPQWRPGKPPREVPLRLPKKPRGGGGGGGGGPWTDPDLQTASYTATFSTTAAFQGQSFTGAIPPDTNLSVGGQNLANVNGGTEIAQIVNTSYAVYDTSGGQVLGSTDLSALFGNLPATANCNANGDGGDTVVLWDKSDGHWLIGQLAYNSDFTQNDYCLAISDTADAAGSYQVYDIPFGSDTPDYPKLAVWGDGIYFSANMFKLKVNRFTGAISATFLGAQACSFPRPTTLPGSVTFTCTGSGNAAIYNILPADVDGPTLPAGSDYYLQFVDNLSSTSGNELTLYQFQSGKLVALGNLSVGTFHEACGGGTCVPELGTTQQLDSLGDRLMYRLSYRNYGASQAMVVNHSVQLSSTSHQAGIRWYKLCSQTAPVPFKVCDQSTFSPDLATYRWMGSIAQDSAGDFGLGYSTSSSSIYPSVAVTGLNSVLGETGMETESTIFPGPNFQDTYSRWGDYSSMAVDPHDDCTFWYTTEYSTTTDLFGIDNFFWGTVIGSFHFPNCAANP
ncbi:MAG TPA: hypothetical protein VGS20_10360 [Candidatus Acidoferrales bacterium]|nr:hypothetical protein [Candidatus Acidoferrales bacterium]